MPCSVVPCPHSCISALLFLLSVIKCLSLRPTDNNLNVPVVMRLIRDGTIYFAMYVPFLFTSVSRAHNCMTSVCGEFYSGGARTYSSLISWTGYLIVGTVSEYLSGVVLVNIISL